MTFWRARSFDSSGSANQGPAASHDSHQSKAESEKEVVVQKRIAELRETLEAQHEAELSEQQSAFEQEMAVLKKLHEVELTNVKSALSTAITATSSAVEQVIADAHPALMQLCMSIAETVTATSLRETESEAVVAAVSWAIEELAHEQSVDIYLNPSTLLLLDQKLDLASLSHGARVRWHAKPTLAAEDWIASSSNTSIRRVRAEILERMRNVLANSLPHVAPAVANSPDVDEENAVETIADAIPAAVEPDLSQSHIDLPVETNNQPQESADTGPDNPSEVAS